MMEKAHAITLASRSAADVADDVLGSIESGLSEARWRRQKRTDAIVDHIRSSKAIKAVCIVMCLLLVISLIPRAARADEGHWYYYSADTTTAKYGNLDSNGNFTQVSLSELTDEDGNPTYEYICLTAKAYWVDSNGNAKDVILNGKTVSSSNPTSCTVYIKRGEYDAWGDGSSVYKSSLSTPDGKTDDGQESTAKTTAAEMADGDYQDTEGFLGPLINPIINEGMANILDQVSISCERLDSIPKDLEALCTQTLATSGATLTTTSFKGNTSDAKALEVYNAIVGIAQSTVQPVALTLLGTVFCLKTIQLLRSAELERGVPYVERLAWLMFEFALAVVLTKNAVAITGAVFNMVMGISAAVANNLATSTTSSANTLKEIVTLKEEFGGAGEDLVGYFATIPTLGATIADFLMIGTISLICTIVSFIVTIAAKVSAYARWIQLSAYLLLAPLMFAFTGFDETKRIFWSYLKSIIAIAAAFLFTIVIIKTLTGICAQTIAGTALAAAKGEVDFSNFTQAVIWSFLLCTTVPKAGAWATELFSR